MLNVQRSALSLEPSALSLSYGPHPPSSSTSRESNRRRRSRRAAGLGRQGADRELARRQRDAHRDRDRAGRQEAASRRGRRRRDGRRRCPAGDRAACDEQDRDARGPRRDSHARLPRRGASQHRVGLALRAAHAGARQRVRNRDSRQRRHRWLRPRGRRARGHVDRSCRSVLQPSGASQVSEVRQRGVGADLPARDADGAGLSGGRILADRAAADKLAASARRRTAWASASISSLASGSI